MGQSASIQRDREEFLNRNSRRLSQIVQDRERHSSSSSSRTRATGQQRTDQLNSTPATITSPPPDSHPSQPIATFSRQISAQSIPALRGGAGNNRDISTRDEIFYEQHEERPLGNMEDLGMRDAPITHITASPMPRRSSRISRLSTMMMPRYAPNEGASEEQQSQGEGRFLRRRLSNTNPSRSPNQSEGNHSHRLSILGSLSPSSHTAPWSRRPRERAPISRPFLLNPDASPPPSGFATSPLGEPLPSRTLPTDPASTPSRLFSMRGNSRLARVRRSISSPFEALLPTTQTSPTQDQAVQTPPQRPSRARPLSAYDSDSRVRHLDDAESSLDMNSPELDRSPPLNREHRISGVPTVLESPERTGSRSDGPSWTERWAERGSIGRREGRRMPSMLRGRSSRLIRRENEGPLPRILHLAATAIAAQLSGMAEPDMQAVGPDDLDGSLQNLFRTLQNATSLTGDGRTQDDDHDPARPGTLPPLNFLRVFRFVGPGPNVGGTRNERNGRRSRAENAPAIDEDAVEDPDGRTVTLVVVGVRSVPSDRAGQEDVVGAEPSLDTLLNLQPPAPSGSLLRHGASGLLRHANGRSRFPHRRRASIGGLNTFPANYDSQRHQRTLSGSSRQGSGDATPNTGAATPVILSESPQGPHPPPSTPAEPGLSAYSSAATTPSRRPSSASAIQQPPMPSRDVATQHLREAGILTSEDPNSRVQHRRRSESEFARHRDLGAGAARRNGVVEPDDVDTGDTPASGSRSWLIYVVGTNLSEDHPALTTPSLFTDVSLPYPTFEFHPNSKLIRLFQNPTYEDMLLLSSLLGPAKPPVASREDVASASGTYRVRRSADALNAAAIQGVGEIRLSPSERCLVCLEDYQVEEELRQLTKCSHVFHRECIDQVRCYLFLQHSHGPRLMFFLVAYYRAQFLPTLSRPRG
jgi:hypothetical protein